MFDITDTWPMITVKDHGTLAEDVVTTPPESPFRGRLFECRSLAIAWDLLNGRFVRRPPLHRMPPPKFESKHYERLDGLTAWLCRGSDGKLWTHLREQRRRRLRSEQKSEYWWGTHARMRMPARKGMWLLNRQAGYSVDRFIVWKPVKYAMTRGDNSALVNYHSFTFDDSFKQGLERKPRLGEPVDPGASEIDWASYCEGWLMGSCEASTPLPGLRSQSMKGDHAGVQNDSRAITE